jgi:ABC-type lipoprotein release transport system permease subunit
MTFGQLTLRNLRYHWRGNFAVFLGVALGTAVLTGALFVGDSLRGSLRDWSLKQLGWVDQALIGGHFVREELAEELMRDGVADRISPILLLQGAVSVEGPDGTVTRRAGKVTILGVDDHFWRPEAPPLDATLWQSQRAEAVLNAALASELGVRPGQQVSLHFQKSSALPREFMLSHQDAGAAVEALSLRVGDIVRGDTLGNRFNLNPSPTAPRNLFVPLHLLQAALNHANDPDSGSSSRLGIDRPVNALLAGGVKRPLDNALENRLTLADYGLVVRNAKARARAFFESLDRNHRGRLTPADWPRLRDSAFAREIDRNHNGSVDVEEMTAYYDRHHNYLTLESLQLFIDDNAAEAAQEAADRCLLRAARTLVYLADSVSDGSREMSYVVIAAVDPALPAPLGPFLPQLPRKADHLGDDEIVLVDWSGSPFRPGADHGPLAVKYYDPEAQDVLRQSQPLRIAGWLQLQGAADDADLTPSFPGITDKASLAEWSPPRSMHFETKHVTRADEDYWKGYRTTPKAYVTLATGQRLWGSRFGKLTSIRLAPTEQQALKAGVETMFETRLSNQLRPETSGLVFQPVRQRALQASAGSTDFGALFLGFSIFLIVAALLLVGLLFRLNLDRRASEVGLLLACGFRGGVVRGLLLAEGFLLAILGSLAGAAAAVLYAWLLLEYLRSWWPGGLERSFLHLHTTPTSLAIGYGISVLVSLVTIVWSARVLGRVAPRALLAGETSESSVPEATRKPRRWLGWLAAGLAILGAACIAGSSGASDHETRASGFFGGGFLLLAGGILAIWILLKRGAMRSGRNIATVGVRNAGRQPLRSLLTVGLLASAAFVVVAVQSFRQEPGRDFLRQNAGSGGFMLVGESDVPFFVDPQSPRGQADLDDSLEQAGVPKSARAQALAETKFWPFRLRAGEDASCLNLYQPQRPRVLGLPQGLIDRGGFSFQETEAKTNDERSNPWLLLNRHDEDDDTIPAFGEANTVVWMLKSGLGKTIDIPAENGQTKKLRIVGLLQDSVFQSELLVSDANFRNLFPHDEGYRFFLIATPPDKAGQMQQLLERGLADHGFTVTATIDRVASALAVENTYLSTFQALGGLGLLLGALGLAIVLLRGVWERRGELALLQALGFRRQAVGWLVLAENGYLLVVGLAIGTVAALLAVAPELLAGTGALPLLRLLGFLVLVLAVGLAAGAAAVMMTLRAPLLAALRRE